MVNERLAEKIKDLADAIGIDALGFAGASEFKDYVLSDSRRRDPKLSLPDARTIVVAGIYIGSLTLTVWTNPWYGRTSRLYLSECFLDVVKPIAPIVDLLKSEGYQALVCDGTADDGSILPLKLAAVRACLGWQGKHSLLISKKFGTFLALGGIITDAKLEHNTKEEPDRCRECDKCQKACPTEALDQAYVLNKSRCLSFRLQVEDLPDEVHAVMENRVGDCEICQDACPWNKKHLDNPLDTHMTQSFQTKIADWENFFYLPNLVELSEKECIEKLGHLNTGIQYELFRRNVLIAHARAKRIGKKSGNMPGEGKKIQV
jgi:epoxyqueuosine reductase QueG